MLYVRYALYLTCVHDSGIPVSRRGDWEQWSQYPFSLYGPLRLTAKYELDALHARIAEPLKALWPDNLADWTERRKTEPFFTHEDFTRPSPGECICVVGYSDYSPQCHFHVGDVILLGYAANLPSVLPSAFYDLHVQSSFAHQAQARSRRAAGNVYNTVEPHATSQLFLGLEAAQVLQVMRGREWLLAAVTSICSSTFKPAKLARCDSGNAALSDHIREVCLSSQTDVLDMANRSYGIDFYEDPLFTLEDMKGDIDDMVKGDDICASCGDRICRQLERLRQYIWDELPFFFGLQTREEGKEYGYETYLDV